MRLTINYGYRMLTQPRRARAPRMIELPDSVEVEVAEVSGSEAPEAVRVEIGTMPFVARLYEGRLYASGTSGEHGAAASLLMEPLHASGMLFATGGCPWNHLAFTIPDVQLGAGDRVLRDDRDATRLAVLDRACNLLLIDGLLWTRSREPGFSLDIMDQKGFPRLYDRPRAGRDPGYMFGLDRRTAFDAFLDKASRAGIRVQGGLPPQFTITRFEPGEARMPEDVLNAGTALRFALRAGGAEIEALDAGAIRILAEMRATTDRLAAGRALPADADALLERLAARAEQAPRLGTACAVGRVALDLSLPSPEGAARRDAVEEDGPSLGALAR